ncbi:MAG: metalloregulator ArsR/SmtB family transcription factor [Spirochaetales bacterium]|nr:metalloregulator ArsR/SmtB family transcription factor [Spirochaetales bacterium]
MNQLIQRLKALGDENRFKIFLLLSENRICVKGLAEKLQISESAVSQHLKVLKEAGLIKGEKVGYYVHYIVQKDVLVELQGLIGSLADGVQNLEEQKEGLNVHDFECTEECQK